MTVLGTRPEIIRLSRVIDLLDRYSEHTLVHTGQNFDDRLSGVFFRELNVREPDHFLGVKAESFGGQVGQILTGIEPLFRKHCPDRLLILGDTNSGLAAVIARRLGIPVYHMEAGNRCYDFRVPEEANRRIIDHMSSVLMPYTNRSRDNLIREGFSSDTIYVTGNPIKEVIEYYDALISSSKVLSQYGLSDGKYFLVTMHRAENVDVESRLRNLVEALVRIRREFGYPVLCSLHPRTQSKVTSFGITLDHAGVNFVEPLGFFDFVRLERSAFCLLSDSGTVQEEACIFGVPNVTIRDVTERPETVECGSNVLSGAEPDTIVRLVKLVTERSPQWQPPPEYMVKNVAASVCRILVGFSLQPDASHAHC
jgi:UDP-N-acetylglucosamine 2-epimerase (non-hydrolysing)